MGINKISRNKFANYTDNIIYKGIYNKITYLLGGKNESYRYSKKDR